MRRGRRGFLLVILILAFFALGFPLVDASILVTSSGEELYEFDVDTEHYAIFAVRHVSTDGVSYPQLDFSDGVTTLASVKIMWTYEAHRNLGFIVRNGHELSQNTSTNARVQWYPGYQYRYEMENDTDSLTMGEARQGAMYVDEIVDCYQVYLEAGVSYNFTLEPSIDSDFDFYLLYGDLSSSKEYLAYSVYAVAGGVERIYHCPGESGYHCLVVTNPLGVAGTYNVTVAPLSVDDSPIELHQKGFGHNAGTGWFSLYTTANTYSLIAAQEITSDPDYISLKFFDNPNHLGSPIGIVDHWDGAYVGGDMIFVTRLAGEEDLRTYVEVDYTDHFEYRFEVENGETTGLVHVTGNSSLQGFMREPEFVDAYQLTMIAGWDYVITLEVPLEVDFDLCLLKGDMAHAGNCENMMLTNSAGADEVISYTPAESGEYLIVVFDREGYAAQYGLTVDEYAKPSSVTTSSTSTTTTGAKTSPPSPFTPEMIQLAGIGGAFGLGIIIAVLVLRRRE